MRIYGVEVTFDLICAFVFLIGGIIVFIRS